MICMPVAWLELNDVTFIFYIIWIKKKCATWPESITLLNYANVKNKLNHDYELIRERSWNVLRTWKKRSYVRFMKHIDYKSIFFLYFIETLRVYSKFEEIS